MKAKFIGDPTAVPEEQVPDTFEAHGLVFEKNKFTEVPEHLESKFIGNNHFRTSGDAKSDEGKEAAQA